MKKLLLTIFITISISVLSQNQRFYYKYQFQTDSTDVETKREELMTLDILEKSSRYYSENVYLNDSVMNAEFKRRESTNDISAPINMSSKHRGVIRYKILKTYPDFSVTSLMNLNMQDYQVNDTRKLKWKILSEKEKIGEWNTQKATTEFAGRKWTAWFSEEIPIQDGPYKFHGLPGLIIKMEDASKTHVMQLEAVKKNVLLRDYNVGFVDQEVKIDDKKLKSVYKAYWKDPVSGMRKMYTEGEVMITDESGKKLDMNQQLKEMEKRARENLKKTNNLLELDLIPH